MEVIGRNIFPKSFCFSRPIGSWHSDPGPVSSAPTTRPGFSVPAVLAARLSGNVNMDDLAKKVTMCTRKIAQMRRLSASRFRFAGVGVQAMRILPVIEVHRRAYDKRIIYDVTSLEVSEKMIR